MFLKSREDCLGAVNAVPGWLFLLRVFGMQSDKLRTPQVTVISHGGSTPNPWLPDPGEADGQLDPRVKSRE